MPDWWEKLIEEWVLISADKLGVVIFNFKAPQISF